MKNILIAGGSGLVGQHLTDRLKERGYNVAWLSRVQHTDSFLWNTHLETIQSDAITWADAIINLAGAGIADHRWSAARKRELIKSRTQSAETIRTELERKRKTDIPYLAASAIGIYGEAGEALLTETTPPSDQSFMVQCCAEWEAASNQIGLLGNPVTILRIGVVLDKTQGALAEIIKPMSYGVGAWFGNGQMWMPWIHHRDLCNMFIWALEERKTGIYNAVSPHPERNKALTVAARDIFAPSAILAPAPAFGLRLALGEMSAIVLNSNQVSAEKVLAAGFQFAYPRLVDALQEIKGA